MRDYSIDVRLIANRHIPHFVRKAIHKAFAWALLRPLTTVNESFKSFVAEKRVEATLNSQTLLLENYLNRTFGQYFTGPGDRIQIVHGSGAGLPVFFTFEEAVIDPVTWFVGEVSSDNLVYTSFRSENAGGLPFNFRVLLPKSFEGNRSVVGQIVAIIEKYKVGGFGYDIMYV